MEKTISEFSIKYLFGEELPKEQNFLLIEDINAKGELILLKLIEEFVEMNFHAILVLLDTIPSAILEELVAKESEKFSIVNTYSDVFSKYYTSIKLHELNLTLKAIRKQLKSERRLVLFFWSLNPLFINYLSSDVIHFYSENVKHAIENSTIEFYLLGKGLVEDLVMRRMIAISHCVIQLEKNTSLENTWNINHLKTMGMDVPNNKINYKIKH